MMERVAAYIRVSTEEQRLHGLSLSAQEQNLQSYADAHGMVIVGWYRDEGVSGRKPIAKRPELQRMIADAQRGLFTRIIFIKLDRFFRSVAEYHACMKMISPVVWTTTEEKYDLASASGRAYVNMKITIAELEADTAGERVRLVNDYKAKSGIPLVGSNRYPFCYDVFPPRPGEKNKYLGKSEQYRVPMEDLIKQVMLTGSVRASMQYINNKYGISLTYRQIMTALKSPLICGSYRQNAAYCDPYITRQEFDALQAVISKNPRTTNKSIYLFSGLLICPECGRRMAGGQHSTTVKGKRYQYNSYRCPAHRINKTCSFTGLIFESAIEKQLLSGLQEIASRKQAEAVAVRNSSAPIRSSIADIEAEIDRLNYSWQKGRIGPEAYDRRYDDLTAALAAAKAELQQQSTAMDYSRVQEVLSGNWQKIYLDLDPFHRRAFWRSIISEIRITYIPNKTKSIADVIFLP